MVNPYRRGLGLGGRGEPMPYTGGGSARPLEPTRGGRGVQLEGDPYADPSRTPPTYGDDGAGESTRAFDPYEPGSYRGARQSGPGNKGQRDQKRRDYDDWENRTADGHEPDDPEQIKRDMIRDWQRAEGDQQHAEVDEMWRRRLRAAGYSDEEIEAIIQEAQDSLSAP